VGTEIADPFSTTLDGRSGKTEAGARAIFPTSSASADTSSHLAMRPIPVVDVDRWKVISEEARTSLLPLCVRNLFGRQAALWSPRRLSEQWGNREVNVVVDLPRQGVPYREKCKDYEKRMKLAEFIAMLDTGKSCYLNQAPLADYAEWCAELDLKSLALGHTFALNLWVGSKTRSGLHFDNADNLFGQIYGRKRALMVSPACSSSLYPFSDNPSKSQVDLDDPDFDRHQKCRGLEVWECMLEPGDGLYMPRGWWHHICSENVSISVNCWHGDSLSEFDHLRAFFAGGVGVLSRAVYDFFWHGLFKRPYHYRLFSPPPPGLQVYERLIRRH
jgi:hypothetical protein